MYREIIDKITPALDEAVSRYQNQLSQIRTGRASAGLLENLPVDYYGTKTPLKQLASITVPESRLIVVQPWDRGGLQAVETAIRSSDLGLNPVNDGQVIRVSIPPLTEERRKELVKFLNQKTEEARINVRNLREEAWKKIQSFEKSGAISEDDKFRGKDDLQKLVNEHNEKIENIREKKEKEIMTI